MTPQNKTGCTEIMYSVVHAQYAKNQLPTSMYVI